jgi:hypothetical protein
MPTRNYILSWKPTYEEIPITSTKCFSFIPMTLFVTKGSTLKKHQLRIWLGDAHLEIGRALYRTSSASQRCPWFLLSGLSPSLSLSLSLSISHNLSHSLSLSLSLSISHYLSHSLSLSTSLKKSLQFQVLRQNACCCGSKFGNYTFII